MWMKRLPKLQKNSFSEVDPESISGLMNLDYDDLQKLEGDLYQQAEALGLLPMKFPEPIILLPSDPVAREAILDALKAWGMID